MLLHSRCISGPIKSRRLGISLGINLLPLSHKICNYNCVYCECGWADPTSELISSLPSCTEILSALQERLSFFFKHNTPIDSITFSGNGEPTLHPEFREIMEGVCKLRNRFLPHTPVSVISNATRIGLTDIIEAIGMADNRILKLDAGTWQTYAAINGLRIPDLSTDIQRVAGHQTPISDKEYTAAYQKLLQNLHDLPYPFIIQTLFFRGNTEKSEIEIDNTAGNEFQKWVENIKYIKPSSLMIYGLDRATPNKNLIKINKEELDNIAKLIREAVFLNVQSYY